MMKQTKNYIPRLIPISEDLLPYIDALSHRTGLVFCSENGKRLYGSAWYLRMLFATQKACGFVPDRNLHSFRHTFCTQLLEKGVSIRTVKELEGHKNISTTLGYIHLTKSNKKNAIGLLNFSEGEL